MADPISLSMPAIDDFLARAGEVIVPTNNGHTSIMSISPQSQLHVGVDLGTAYLVLVVLDENNQPIAGEYQFAQVVRDGLVVDYIGAIDLLKAMKLRMEKRLGRELRYASSGYPPGVPQVEVRATANVVEGAGFTCTGLIDEPSAANNVLKIRNGVIVDVGGGTTGIAIVKDNKVIYTADEPTGGTHFSLVIAGALDISFEEAEQLKVTPSEQGRLFTIVRPVMEKVASIIVHHIQKHNVQQLFLVGGSTAFSGMAQVIQDYTGLQTSIPTRPLFVTPLGIAMYHS